ncbi:MAG: RHS repeat domain-containing protein, partial [Allomuricauda sp.]
HMNGRIYDPQIGRFLSADTIIQAPTDLQFYNRYSYVRNNPLRYTDPTGYVSEERLYEEEKRKKENEKEKFRTKRVSSGEGKPEEASVRKAEKMAQKAPDKAPVECDIEDDDLVSEYDKGLDTIGDTSTWNEATVTWKNSVQLTQEDMKDIVKFFSKNGKMIRSKSPKSILKALKANAELVQEYILDNKDLFEFNRGHRSEWSATVPDEFKPVKLLTTMDIYFTVFTESNEIPLLGIEFPSTITSVNADVKYIEQIVFGTSEQASSMSAVEIFEANSQFIQRQYEHFKVNFEFQLY